MSIRTYFTPHVIQSRYRWIGSVVSGAVVAMALLWFPQDANSQDASGLLSQAVAFEKASDYANAAASYREYLLQPAPQSATQRHARLKLPVLQEAAKYGAGSEMQIYLKAMDLRAAGDARQADAILEDLIRDYSGSSLIDDAVYLRAYIALMDHYDYQRASQLLQQLRNNYPDSRYIDTALFAEAIVFEQTGDSESAIARMEELRDRHTGVSVAGMSWAKDQYLSRLWFERSSKRIEYLQERTEFATRIISMTPYGQDGYAWQAELVINQQNMTLLLNESAALKSTVFKSSSSTRSNTRVNAFSGIVMGQPDDSWARITIDNHNVRGMVSVYGENHELMPVTTGGSLSDFHTLLLGDADGNVTEEPDKIVTPPKSTDNLTNFLRSVKQADDTELTPGKVSQVAMIGVVIDSKYNDYYSGRGAEEALSILNTTDGIFREQFGIALMVDTVVVIDNNDNDPMNLGSVTMETMMRNFKDYRLASPDLGSDIGMATLFSGNKNNDSALGLAWIGSACRTDGFDVSVVTPYKMPSLLSTHEIGHTMGAPHDSDTSCASQTRHIMWPFLSSASGRTFSSCSKEAVAETMAANNCHIDAMDLSLDLDDVYADSLTLSVTNQDYQRATPSAMLTLSGPGVGSAATSQSCNQIDNDKIQCGLGTLTPMQSEQITFDFQNELSDTAQVVATVEGSGFIDVTTFNNSFKTDIHGNLSPYTGQINSDPVNVGNYDYTSAAKSDSSIAGAEGGGLFNPAVTLLLTILLVARRRLVALQ